MQIAETFTQKEMEPSISLLLENNSVIECATERNLCGSTEQQTTCEMMQDTASDGLKETFQPVISLNLHNTECSVINTPEGNVLIDSGENGNIISNDFEVDNISATISNFDSDFLVYPDFKRFDHAFKQYQKDTQTSFCIAHNSRDFSKFVTLEDILLQSKQGSKRSDGGLPFIRWEYQSGGFPIPFFGYPFISVGHAKYDCCQGKDLNLTSKDKARHERLRKLKDGIPISPRTLSQPTKKMGCPVTTSCKKFYAFPNYAIRKDTKRNRSAISLQLRKLFANMLQKVENIEAQQDQTYTESALGTLIYITKFPDSAEHKYHLEFNSAIEPLMLPPSDLMLGAVFVSYKDLEIAVNRYRSERNARLYRSAEDLIRFPNSPLVFKQITYRCFHTNKKVKFKSSFKQGCEMHIRFGVSDDGSQLVVKSMSEEHNHEINEESVVKEALHPELCSFVSKLVWSDTNIGIDEVKKQLENYVCNEMFKDQVTPPRTRRQYFPSKKQIRYFMAKAKASLHISQDTELKLAAQAEKLKEAHSDEKMIFNFKIKHDVNPLDFGVHQEESVGDNEETFLPAKVEGQTEGNLHENAKVLFCHQTPHQQRLLKRYNAQLILTQVNDIYSKIPFPLFCLYVQTNVDFQLVGEFIIQNNTTDMIAEGFQTIKEWNPGWNPKFVIVDYSEEQIHAVENAFPGAFLLISDASREQAWMDWLSNEENGVSEHKDDVLKYLQAIANSYSEDTLNTAARELEESEVWKMSDKMRNWFQIHWLSQAKRWVAGYRPDDYLLTSHTGRTLEDELKVFKSIKLVSKSAPLQDVIQQLVEHVVPVTTKQYELLNQESFKLQNELLYSYPDIPNYLSSRPGKLTYHIYERIKLAAEQSYVISYLHPGIFTVQGRSSDDDLLHTVSFGDASSYPSCDCLDWQQYKVPCCHLCSVFSNYPGWTWDMLTLAYKNAPVLSVDWSALSGDEGKEVPGFRIDNSTQTTGASLLGSATDIAKHNRMGDARISETPQVLATQCRALLQQLSKLQLAQHSRENLHRLKSELKDLISVFSSAPKQKHPLSSPGLTGSFVIQNKAGRTRKINLATSTQQSVFEQYNVKPITPKQVISPSNAERTSYATRSRTGSDTNTSKIDDSHAGNSHAVTAENLLTKTIYVVDPAHVLATSAKKVSEEIDNTPVAKVTTRKRAEHVSVFTKPLEKRSKVDGETDKGQTEQVFQRSESLEFSEEPAANLLAASNTATESPMIDCQTISHISLDVSDAISDGLTANDVQMSFANTLQTLTVTALPQSVTYQQEPNTGTNEDSNIEESVVK